MTDRFARLAVAPPAFGVPVTLGMAARVTFLVGTDGRIAPVYPKVDPGVHAAEVLDHATRLR